VIADNDLFAKEQNGSARGFVVVTAKIIRLKLPNLCRKNSRSPDFGCAFNLKSKSKEKTILVTKDINLRMKAKSLGILTEDYFG
jgi:PhoH-like ATPase